MKENKDFTSAINVWEGFTVTSFFDKPYTRLGHVIEDIRKQVQKISLVVDNLEHILENELNNK